MSDYVPLIGLIGYAGSGKDTFADAMVELGWRKAAFADQVKEFLLAQNPLVLLDGAPIPLSVLISTFGWDRAKRSFTEVRRLLQTTGTEAGRGVVGRGVWVDALFSKWDHQTPLVVSDVRFPNEAEAIIQRGGLLIRIERPGFEPGPGAHESETAMSQWRGDITVLNTGDKEGLFGMAPLVVKRAIKELVSLSDNM